MTGGRETPAQRRAREILEAQYAAQVRTTLAVMIAAGVFLAAALAVAAWYLSVPR